jgi:hypothetical protein
MDWVVGRKIRDAKAPAPSRQRSGPGIHRSVQRWTFTRTRVTPAKHAAQAAVRSLVFASDKDGGVLVAGYETAGR